MERWDTYVHVPERTTISHTHTNDNLLCTQDPHTCTRKNAYIELLKNVSFAIPIIKVCFVESILFLIYISNKHIAHTLGILSIIIILVELT